MIQNSREILEKTELNQQQLECVNTLNGHILVLSGAGTGKTTVIINRFLKHLENNIPPYKIMCITFSNKAANEINKRLSKYLEDMDGLWIGTFHKICFRLLQKYGSLKSNTSIIDEDDQKKITEKLEITQFFRDIQLFKEQLPIKDCPEFHRAYKIYQEFLDQNNLIDFGDIIFKTVQMLEDNQDLCQHIREKFDYIMVDEYQDTSKTQNHLIKLLTNHNLCCVGDDDQSIYSWRGACVDNILQFSKNFENAKIFRLEQNYRCTKEILSVANYVVQQNNNRMPKEIWTTKNGEVVKICCTKYEPDYITQEIRCLSSLETVGILVRTSMLIKPIEMSLVKYDIPYKILGGIRFFEKAEIKTALAYLKAVFFEDILSIERILTTPKRGIGPKKLEKILKQIQHGLSFLSALKEIGHADLAEQSINWRALDKNKPKDVFKTIWQESSCEEIFPDRKENIDILINKIGQFKTISEFLEGFFAVDTEEDARVVIMTIHGAKGLEFDNVFIPGLVEGVFPNAKTIMEGNLEEERRLMYVALTRAKKKLFLSYNLTSNFTKNNMFGPSRFLFNLPKNCIDYQII